MNGKKIMLVSTLQRKRSNYRRLTITILKSLTRAIFFQSDDDDNFFDQAQR